MENKNYFPNWVVPPELQYTKKVEEEQGNTCQNASIAATGALIEKYKLESSRSIRKKVCAIVCVS